MPSLTSNPAQAQLIHATDGQSIVFHYNPTEIGISHDADGSSTYVHPDAKAASTAAALSALYSLGSTRLALPNLVFTGAGCRDIVMRLLKWVTPVTGGRSVSMGQRPPLRFVWGNPTSGFDLDVELMRFDCTYTRFTGQGVPIRAEVRHLTLHIVQRNPNSSLPPGAGPTAGLAPSATRPGRAPLTTGGPRRDTARDAMDDPLRVPAPSWRQGGGIRP